VTSRDCSKRKQLNETLNLEKEMTKERSRTWTVNYGIRVFNEVIRNNNKIDSEILKILQNLFRFTLDLHGDSPVRPNGNKFTIPFRFFNCENYGDCLNDVAHRMWSSFFCPIYCSRRNDIDPEYIEINREEATYLLNRIKDE